MLIYLPTGRRKLIQGLFSSVQCSCWCPGAWLVVVMRKWEISPMTQPVVIRHRKVRLGPDQSDRATTRASPELIVTRYHCTVVCYSFTLSLYYTVTFLRFSEVSLLHTLLLWTLISVQTLIKSKYLAVGHYVTNKDICNDRVCVSYDCIISVKIIFSLLSILNYTHMAVEVCAECGMNIFFQLLNDQ